MCRNARFPRRDSRQETATPSPSQTPIRNALLVLTGRRKVYYGWWLLAGSILAVAVGSGVSFWSFGLYVKPLEAEFGWSRAEVSLGFSVAFLASGLVAPLIGGWIDRYGPRPVIMVGAVLTAATYLLLATTDSLWQWHLYQSINAVFRQMMFFIPFQALISRWFNRRRGVAVGVLGVGFSLAGLIFVPLIRIVIDGFGWDGAFIFSGILIIVVFVPLSLFVIRNDPSDVGALVDGDMPADRKRRPQQAFAGLTAGQAIRTPLFWALALAVTTFFYGLVGWMVHAVPYYESVGISPGWAAALVSLAAGGGMISRLVFGWAADRMRNVERGAVVLAFFLAGAMLTLWVTDASVVGLAVFFLFFIIGSGGGPMLEPILLTRAFGVAHFGSILGAIVVVETVGQILSPTIAGAIFDETGSYSWALVMFALAFVASMFFFWLASRLPRPVIPAPPPSGEAVPRDRAASRPAEAPTGGS